MITSSVKDINGIPTLIINDEVVAPNAYITYFIENARYDDFTEAGYNIFSVPIYFATRGIQEMNEIPPFAPGIFEKEEPDFSIADRTFRQIIDACPNAYIFPRVNVTLPLRWEQENEQELCDRGNLSQEKRRPCFSSDAWAEETKKYLGMFIDHIEKAPYRDHIFGYQIATGNSEEWFSFDLVGSVGKRSREKFQQRVIAEQLEGTEGEYYRFLAQMTAERVCEMARFVKEKTNHRLVVGSFYGYSFECPHKYSCHAALHKVLHCDSIDFLCSPVSYMLSREAGYDHPYMLPLDSLKKHGKLYFSENDTRTHLSKPLFDIPHFHNENYRPRPRWLAIENMKQHYARALINAHAFWWFDMGGGWYHYSSYMELAADCMKLTKASMGKDMGGASEIAVLVDENVFPYVHNRDNYKAMNTCYHIRKALGLIGTPYASYLAEDYPEIKDAYKAFILLVPQMSPMMQRIMEEEPDALVITAANADITTDELRQFCREKGVHLYSNKDAVIYANQSYLFLHTASNGKAELSLPAGKRLKQTYGDAVDIENTVLPKHTGFLFEIIPEHAT